VLRNCITAMLLAREAEGSEEMKRTLVLLMRWAQKQVKSDLEVLQGLRRWAGAVAARFPMAWAMFFLALVATFAAVLVVPEVRGCLRLDEKRGCMLFDENPPDVRQGEEEPNVPEGEGGARLGVILKSYPKEEGIVFERSYPKEEGRAFATGKPRGVKVIEVIQGGPADRAGLQRNDVIDAVGSTDISDIVDFTRKDRHVRAWRFRNVNCLSPQRFRAQRGTGTAARRRRSRRSNIVQRGTSNTERLVR
jgi:hypothetical protein